MYNILPYENDTFLGYERDDNLFILQPKRSGRPERTGRIDWPTVMVWTVGVAGGIAFWSWIVAVIVEGL